MGAQGAANIVHRRTLAEARERGEDVEALRAKLIQEYEDTLCNPYQRPSAAYVDSVIALHTRGYVARALRTLREKRETLRPEAWEQSAVNGEDRPLLRSCGHPDDTELAVLTAVVSALAAVRSIRTNPWARSVGVPALRRPCGRALARGSFRR